MNYTEKPKTRAGKVAWDAFTKAIGEPPSFMSYGHAGAPTGWQWTAEDKTGNIYTFQAIWGKASLGYIKGRLVPTG